MQDYQHLSAEELKAQLQDLEAQKSALTQALQAQHEQEKEALALEIKTLVSERGFDLEDITDQLFGRKRSRAGSPRRSSASFIRYADPDNPDNTYARGRMPAWLNEKMSAKGYDPTSPEHRAEFKETHLVRLAA